MSTAKTRPPTEQALQDAAVILSALLTLPRERWLDAMALVCRVWWDERFIGMLKERGVDETTLHDGRTTPRVDAG